MLKEIMCYGCLVGGIDRVPESWSNDRKHHFTQKCSDMYLYGIDKTNESDDLVDREWDGKERLLQRYNYVGHWIWSVLYV